MNPETQKQLNDFIQALLNGLQSGAVFLKDQIPPILQEKILLDRVYFLMIFITGILTIVSYRIPRNVRLRGVQKDDYYEDSDKALFLQIAQGICIGIGIIIVAGNLYPTLMVFLAPRLYLIEWAKEWVK